MIVPHFAATARIVGDGATARRSNNPLVDATIERCVRDFGINPHVRVAVESNIPRSVGLAGSSAIVIAVIQVIGERFGLELSPMEVAAIAHGVEREDLAIAGGWQDQIVQSHGATGLMEFAGPISHRRLEVPHEPAIAVFISWRAQDSESSGLSHAGLQARRETSLVRGVMEELAQCGRAAADAIEARDVHLLKEAIGQSFALRCRVMDVLPQHQLAVERANAHGAVANFAGSGGAVTGVMPKDEEGFLAGMRADGYDVVSLSLE